MPIRYAVVRYRTAPERIARLLPPKLEPASVAEVLVDFLTVDLGEHKSVFVPKPYCESALWVRASYKGEEGFLHGRGVFSSEQVFTKQVQPFPNRLQHHRSRVNLQEIRDLGSRKDFINLGYLTENLLRKGGRHWVSSSSGWSS